MPPYNIHPHTFLPDLNGNLDFGSVPEIIDAITSEHLTLPLPIRLQSGNRHYGHAHICQNHGEKITAYTNLR